MNKREYLNMLIQENIEGPMKQIYDDIIDCVDIALSNVSDSFVIKSTFIGLKELYDEIVRLSKSKNNVDGVVCVGPFEAAEAFATLFGTNYVRPSRRDSVKIRLEDFL